MDRAEKRDVAIPALESVETLERLKALVDAHRVCWEVWPEQLSVEGRGPLRIGFNLVLNGAHAHDEDRPSPGCEKCTLIFEHLREIAEWIVPRVERPTRYDIQIFDHAIHFAPERHNRADVALTIKILHRTAIDRPEDECEVLCLNEMKAKLVQLEAQHRQWKESASG